MSSPGIEPATLASQPGHSATFMVDCLCSYTSKLVFDKNNTHGVQCVYKIDMLDVYWNCQKKNPAFLLTNVDVINYCLQNFAWIHQTIIHMINTLYAIRVEFIKCKGSKSQSKHMVGKREVDWFDSNWRHIF